MLFLIVLLLTSLAANFYAGVWFYLHYRKRITITSASGVEVAITLKTVK